mmetsp:Transcript_30223/g.73664  ORF Transcript_30223/g.73664 Transcript_30223/m.73664 type:complete len:344 (-) Transcript_30223:192-1223(-)
MDNLHRFPSDSPLPKRKQRVHVVRVAVVEFRGHREQAAAAGGHHSVRRLCRPAAPIPVVRRATAARRQLRSNRPPGLRRHRAVRLHRRQHLCVDAHRVQVPRRQQAHVTAVADAGEGRWRPVGVHRAVLHCVLRLRVRGPHCVRQLPRRLSNAVPLVHHVVSHGAWPVLVRGPGGARQSAARAVLLLLVHGAGVLHLGQRVPRHHQRGVLDRARGRRRRAHYRPVAVPLRGAQLAPIPPQPRPQVLALHAARQLRATQVPEGGVPQLHRGAQRLVRRARGREPTGAAARRAARRGRPHVRARVRVRGVAEAQGGGEEEERGGRRWRWRHRRRRQGRRGRRRRR